MCIRDSTIDGVGNGTGVDIFFRHGVEVKNGRIKQFGTGVVAIFADNNRLIGIRAAANANAGIYLARSDGNHLERIEAFNNGLGIVLTVDAGGGPSKGSDGNVLVHNRAIHNAGDGIVLGGSTSNRLEQNEASENGADGIELRTQVVNLPEHSNDNLLSGNRASRNKEHGIVLRSGSSFNRLLDNRTNRNLEGIDLQDASNNNTVSGNEATGNDDEGIEISSSSENRVDANKAVRNGISGFYVFGSSHNNHLELNLASDNEVDGIFVEAASSGSLLVQNLTRQNGDDGIDVDSASTTLTRNRANRNVDLGIEAVADVTDGGGNRATGNGNPAQCLNVACSP